MNDYTFAKEFVGNLRPESDPVPVRVNTRLRVMTEETAREVREYISGATGSPRYVFNATGISHCIRVCTRSVVTTSTGNGSREKLQRLSRGI
jgi:hypothetical protein